MKKSLSFPGQDTFVVQKNNKQNFAQFTSGITTSPDDGTMQSPTLPVLPVFPDFSLMDCPQLAVAYGQLNETLNAPSFVAKDPAWVSAYEKAIAYVQALQMSKGCQTKHPPIDETPPIKTTTSTPQSGSTSAPVPGASGGMGYSGGVAAPVPASSTAKTKKPFPWLWVIIGGAVVLYVMSGKKD